MNKKRLVVTMSAGLLALSALGGTAFAHWGPGNADAIQEKIAEELGQDQETVAQAFATVRNETRDAAIAVKLAKSVEAGAITQAEADEIHAWYDSAPDALSKTKKAGPHVELERVAEMLGVDAKTLESAGRAALKEAAEAAFAERLDASVTEGRITEEEATEMLQRFQDRPQRKFGQGQRGQHGHSFGPAQRGGHGRGGFGGGMRDFGGLRDLAPETEDVPAVVNPRGLAA
jgi:hypothetical protein